MKLCCILLVYNGLCFLQATDAAEEAEQNARKAKQSVNSVLTTINDLLNQLGNEFSKSHMGAFLSARALAERTRCSFHQSPGRSFSLPA